MTVDLATALNRMENENVELKVKIERLQAERDLYLLAWQRFGTREQVEFYKRKCADQGGSVQWIG